MQANVASLEALASVVPRSAHVVLLSTAYATGHGRGDPTAVDSYRNTYEWSKAAAERLVGEIFDHAVVVRFPIVVGRRSDGHIGHLSGLMKLFKPLVSGLVPAIVGRREAFLDIVCVDDVATHVADLATADGRSPRLQVLGHGAIAPTVGDAFDTVFESIDAWRIRIGIPPMVRPPIVSPDRWDRFHLPLARRCLSPVQLLLVDMLSEYRPYLCMTRPFDVDVQMDDPLGSLRRSVDWWATTNPRAAGVIAQPWVAVQPTTSAVEPDS